jgi:hypothetical protein
MLLLGVGTLLLCLLTTASSNTIFFNGVPNNSAFAAANTELLNALLSPKSLVPGSTLIIPNDLFYMMGGIQTSGLKDVTIQIDGTLKFMDDRSTWPTDASGHVLECILMTHLQNVLFTSSGLGTLDGSGAKWWGYINYAIYKENRPRLFKIQHTKNITIEKLFFKDSPRWTLDAEDSDGFVARYLKIEAAKDTTHTLADLGAFNTDGIDIQGHNVHIHDCDIWCQDDCVSVKDNSRDMLIERVTCSGVGLVIGSIGDSVVRNITFRDSVMPNTFKGIYLKTRWAEDAVSPKPGSAQIRDILYENITMYNPEQYAIWIGPAQEVGQCSLLWPTLGECNMPGYHIWDNIVLRDITIVNPLQYIGVLMGNETNPMQNVIFDNVVVVNQSSWSAALYGKDYLSCKGINGVVKGASNPHPKCFQ